MKKIMIEQKISCSINGEYVLNPLYKKKKKESIEEQEHLQMRKFYSSTEAMYGNTSI